MPSPSPSPTPVETTTTPSPSPRPTFDPTPIESPVPKPSPSLLSFGFTTSADSIEFLLTRSEADVFHAFEVSIARGANIDASLVTVMKISEAGVPLNFLGRRLSDMTEIDVEASVENSNEEAHA